MPSHRFRLTLLFAGLLALNALGINQAHADAMRCGRELLPDDASLAATHKVCGPPTRETRRIEHRVWSVVGLNGSVATYQRDVVVDDLLYDFGPNEFVYNLTFEDEKMIRMVRGDWGAPR